MTSLYPEDLPTADIVAEEDNEQLVADAFGIDLSQRPE